MEDKEAKKIVEDYLFNPSNPDSNFYKKSFKKYEGYGEETPISPIYMPNANAQHNIILTEEVVQQLEKIREISLRTGNEIPFFLFGEEKANGALMFDIIVADFKGNSTREADFRRINQQLIDFVKMYKDGKYIGADKQIICHGHSHGKNELGDNFSFGDLIGYVQMRNIHPAFVARELETLSLVLSPRGDYNFIMYENNPVYPGFYTFPNVYKKHNDGVNVEALPAYNNGNYLTSDRVK